jgi:putative cell wall-binding protein
VKGRQIALTSNHWVDLDICAAEELTHHINAALLTGRMEGRPTSLLSQVDLDVCAAEELAHYINVTLLTSHMERRPTVLIG